MKLIGHIEKEKRRIKNALDLEKRLSREHFELIGKAQLVDGQIRFSEPVTRFLYWETAPIDSKDTEIRLIEKSMLPDHMRIGYGNEDYLVYAREKKELKRYREERRKTRQSLGKFHSYVIQIPK